MICLESKYRLLLLIAVLFLAGACNGLLGQVLYVGNSGDDTLSTYVIDETTGSLTEILPRVAAPGTATSVAIHPSGKFAYVTNGGNASLGANGPSVATYSIDPTTAALTLVNTLSLANGTGPQGGAIDSAGKFLFVANGGANGGNISVFGINPADGSLSPVTGSPFAAQTGITKVLIHPSGKFVFATAGATGQIVAYSIDAGGGLTPLPGSPFAARTNIPWAAMDAAGKFLFLAERQQNGVLVYAIDNTTGALNLVSGSPFSSPGSIGGVAVDPTGKFLYITNAGGTLNGFRIGATGALTPIPPGFFPSQFGSFDAIVDPSGQFLYVTSNQNNEITAWSIDPSSGALTPHPSVYNTGNNPQRAATILLNPPVIPPIIGNVITNYFTQEPPGMPNAGIAQGSKITIFGTNIGPASGSSQNPPYQPQFGGVSIQIQSGGTATAAFPVFVSDTFVSAVVPSTTPTGDATVTLTYNGRSTAPISATIVPISVGIRALNGQGNGPTKAWNAPPDAGPNTDPFSLPPNTLSQSAIPGQTMIVMGTGFGAVTADETQNFQQVLNVPATVIVGNKTTTPTLEVRNPGGIDYFAFQIPSDAPLGCYVPLAVQAGGVTSNVTTISISSTGASCSDPTGLAASDIDQAQSAGHLNIATIMVRHTDLGPLGVEDKANGNFAAFDVDSLAAAFAPTNGSGIRVSFGTPPLGTCTVAPGTPTDLNDLFTLSHDPTTGQFLSVGSALNLNGPAGTLQLLAPSYSAQSNNPFTAGGYTVDNGAGAASFGPFKATLNLPPAIAWTNAADLTAVDRTRDLTLTWTGGMAGQEFAMIVGLAVNDKATGGFLCAADVSAGQFTVPAWVLSTLPASGVIPMNGQNVPGGLLGVGTAPLTSTGRFNAPGFDFALFTYEIATINLANYQ